MSDPAVICADGASPLTRFVALLIRVPDDLKSRMNRDDEAIRRLMGPPSPARRKELERAVQERMEKEGLAGCCRTSRIWTRRDVRRLDFRLGMVGYGSPACRVGRYLSRISPLCISTFRDAVHEVRRDGEFDVIGVKLDAARGALQELLTPASAISQDNGRESDFQSAKCQLAEIAYDLLPWTKSSKPEDAPETARKPITDVAVPADQGVSLFDVAFAIEEDDIAAKECVKKWINGKQVNATPIGKCPKDGRKQLYRLSEILSDVAKILRLTSKDKAAYRKVLATQLRGPGD